MHVILRRQHLNFYLTTITKTVLSFCFCTLELVYIYYIELYLTTSPFNTVVSFCFYTLELIAISPRNKPIVIFHRKLTREHHLQEVSDWPSRRPAPTASNHVIERQHLESGFCLPDTLPYLLDLFHSTHSIAAIKQ